MMPRMPKIFARRVKRNPYLPDGIQVIGRTKAPSGHYDKVELFSFPLRFTKRVK